MNLTYIAKEHHMENIITPHISLPFILNYAVVAPTSSDGLDPTTAMPERTQMISDGKLDEDPEEEEIDYEDVGETDETVPPQTGLVLDSGTADDE